MLLPYERLTSEALDAMRDIYHFVGQPFPGEQIVSEVDAGSIGKGSNQITEISDDIQAKCEALLRRLDDAAGYVRQKL